MAAPSKRLRLTAEEALGEILADRDSDGESDFGESDEEEVDIEVDKRGSLDDELDGEGAYIDDLWVHAFRERCGVLQHDDEATPQEIFESLLNQRAIDLLVRETNRYADQYFASRGGINQLPPSSPARKWKRINAEDMRAFIAVILFMRMARLPTYPLYWSSSWLMNLGIRDVFSRDRFLLILTFLHCADNNDMPARDSPNYDRLYKVREVTDIVVENWQEQYYPSREISGDETVLPFKGTTSLKNYNPQKPHKWGLTIWSLAEATTGYVYNWNINPGKGQVDPRTQNNDGRGKVHWVTWDLLESTGVLGKNHHFYCDNYFSSPTLFDDLANQQTGACGTLRRNRTGTPDAIKRAKPAKTDPAVVARSGKCLYLSWQDRNLVNLVTTIHTDDTFVKRTRCKNADDGWQDRVKPKAVELYTRYMRGVDLADQAMWYSMIVHRSVKWWKKVLFGLLEVCLCNSLVIYRALHPQKNVDRNRFRLSVISHLIGGYSNRGGPHRGIVANANVHDVDADVGQLAKALQLRFQPGPHFPEINPARTPNGKQSKPNCIVCSTRVGRVQTQYQCKVCKVPLCPSPCMERFHTVEVSWRKPRKPAQNQ